MYKLIGFIILLFILLIQFNNINNEHESFKNIFKEHFQNEAPGGTSMTPGGTSLVPESSYKEELKNELKEQEKCDDKNNDDCLFGCPKDEDKAILKEDTGKPKERKTNIDEMMMTIEDTEKLCNLIEEKDKERAKKEAEEHMMKQIELNKRFLIQQKAQNKQIEDLEKIIKEMTFTQKMNEVGVEKCGVNADQCLTDKEKELIELVKMKKKKNKSVKVNLNVENFQKRLLNDMKNKLNLSDSELSKLYEAVKNGSLNVEDLKNQLIMNQYNNPYRNNNNNNNFQSGSVEGCPNCKIDLSEYIDRCKIPCHKCRDPAWNCPQDRK